MASDTSDIRRDACMLVRGLASQGYDWWWHSFTARDAQSGEEKPFFIEFFVCNPKLGGSKPLFGLSADGSRPGDSAHRPSYLMVKVGTWGKDARQLHRFFSWDEVDLGKGVPFYVAADDCLCCETNLVGRVEVTPEEAQAHPEWMSDAGSAYFDLSVDKQIAFNVGYGAGTAFREMQSFDMFWHAEGIKTKYSGDIWLDGRHYVVTPDESFGYADKNWGRDFTTPWVWLSSWDLTSNITGRRLKNSVVEIGGGRPVAFGIALNRKLLGCMNYEGVSHEFNFSKLWTGSKTEFDCRETETQVIWHVDQKTNTHRLVTDITCEKADMLLMNYESPDGLKRHNRLWNGGNGKGRVRLFKRKGNCWVLVDDMSCAHVGCEYGEYDS